MNSSPTAVEKRGVKKLVIEAVLDSSAVLAYLQSEPGGEEAGPQGARGR